MKLINIFDNIRIYSNGDQIVHYYTNTAIPEHYEKIKDIIINFDTLIVAGHDPDSIFIDTTKNKIHFIGFEGTSYYNENENEYGSDEPNGVVNRLHIKEILNRFEKYTYIHDNGTHLSFDDWKSYYDHYLKYKNEKS